MSAEPCAMGCGRPSIDGCLCAEHTDSHGLGEE